MFDGIYSNSVAPLSCFSIRSDRALTSFNNAGAYTTVKVPNEVRSIGQSVFKDMTSIKTI